MAEKNTQKIMQERDMQKVSTGQKVEKIFEKS